MVLFGKRDYISCQYPWAHVNRDLTNYFSFLVMVFITTHGNLDFHFQVEHTINHHFTKKALNYSHYKNQYPNIKELSNVTTILIKTICYIFFVRYSVLDLYINKLSQISIFILWRLSRINVFG